jgi:hypothetical protein
LLNVVASTTEGLVLIVWSTHNLTCAGRAAVCLLSSAYLLPSTRRVCSRRVLAARNPRRYDGRSTAGSCIKPRWRACVATGFHHCEVLIKLTRDCAHAHEAIATIAEPATPKDPVVEHTSDNAASPPPDSRNALTPTTECDDLLSSLLASAKPAGDGILSEVMRQRADDAHHGLSSWETTTGARTNHAPQSFSREEFYLDSATTI